MKAQLEEPKPIKKPPPPSPQADANFSECVCVCACVNVRVFLGEIAKSKFGRSSFHIFLGLKSDTL